MNENIGREVVGQFSTNGDKQNPKRANFAPIIFLNILYKDPK